MKSVRLSIGIALLAGLVGCEPPPPPPVEMPRPRPVVDVTPAGRARTMQMVVESMSTKVDRLPGEGMTAHRRLLVGLLDDTAQMLLLANGPDQSPAFANRIRVIDHSREVAADPTLPRERMNSVENQALHAAYLAVADLRARLFFDDDKLPPLVDALKSKAADLNTIDETTGPMHDLPASDAFRALLPVLSQLSTDMTARFGGGGTPEAGPDVTPPPPVPPTTAESTTEPTTGPTTSPADDLQNKIDKMNKGTGKE